MGRLHFLLITFPSQGNINPVLRLAKLFVRDTGDLATFAISKSAFRRMYPSSPDRQVDDGGVSCVPISDGFDEGLKDISQFSDFIAQFNLVGPRSLSHLVEDLAVRGRPVTCIIYTMLQPWAADVAREHGIPSLVYWIQPALVFAIYYHYFHGYDSIVNAHAGDPLFTLQMPGLPPLQIRDLPSFLTMSPGDPMHSVMPIFKEIFDTIDSQVTWPKPKVLINTFEDLENDVITYLDKLDLVTVGPLVPSWSFDEDADAKDQDDSSGDLIKPDEKRYIEWLDTKPERSVVYVSFGSYAAIGKRQMEEMVRGLKESGWPYLWVVTKHNKFQVMEQEEGEDAMVVEWCSQVRVLMHPAVGCFVTHCGWNSTIESLICGVPTVGVPQWTDQMMNAKLMEGWGVGVTGMVDEEGVVEGLELKRCLEIVMGEGERREDLRKNASEWSVKAKNALREGGSSLNNLKTFRGSF